MSRERPRKVIVLGSGALKIGEAGEFDYSGSQCLKALQEEGIFAVVVNPNIATLQTDRPKLGKVYLQPLTPEFVEPIIQEERPEAILLSFGGQTALNCGIGLADRGTLRRHKVRVLGTPLAGIRATEDRARFVTVMKQARVPTLPSRAVYSIEDAERAAATLGYPVMIRVAFTLGGKGGGIAFDRAHLAEVAGRGLRASPVGQISSNATWDRSSRSSTRWSAMFAATSSRSATWRTCSRCGSTPGTTSSPRRRRP